MFSNDTVRELFVMASSENSAPQRFLIRFILWKLRRYPQNTVSLSFFKVNPPKKNLCYPPKMLPCCSFSLKQFDHIYPKHPGNCLMYIQDILAAAQTFCWYMWISWEIRMTSLHNPMVFLSSGPLYGLQNSAKNSFHPENANHACYTQKKDLAKFTKSFCWFPAFMVNTGKLMFLTWLDSPIGVYGATFLFRHHKRISTPSIAEFMP